MQDLPWPFNDFLLRVQPQNNNETKRYHMWSYLEIKAERPCYPAILRRNSSTHSISSCQVAKLSHFRPDSHQTWQESQGPVRKGAYAIDSHGD